MYRPSPTQLIDKCHRYRRPQTTYRHVPYVQTPDPTYRQVSYVQTPDPTYRHVSYVQTPDPTHRHVSYIQTPPSPSNPTYRQVIYLQTPDPTYRQCHMCRHLIQPTDKCHLYGQPIYRKVSYASLLTSQQGCISQINQNPELKLP